MWCSRFETHAVCRAGPCQCIMQTYPSCDCPLCPHAHICRKQKACAKCCLDLQQCCQVGQLEPSASIDAKALHTCGHSPLRHRPLQMSCHQRWVGQTAWHQPAQGCSSCSGRPAAQNQTQMLRFPVHSATCLPSEEAMYCGRTMRVPAIR